MTVLIALKTLEGVWIGSDSRISSEAETVTDDFQKWRRADVGLWWGAAGSIRVYSFPGLYFDPLLATTPLVVCESLRNFAKIDGWAEGDGRHGDPVDYQFNALAATPYEIIRYAGSGAHVQITRPGAFTAIGTGAPYALGALAALQDRPGISPEDAVLSALGAAVRFDQGCGGELFIKEIVA